MDVNGSFAQKTTPSSVNRKQVQGRFNNDDGNKKSNEI